MIDRLRSAVERLRTTPRGAGTFNSTAAEDVANATGPNPSERGGRRTSPPSGGESIKVSDSSAAADGPERRGPCTRDYETDRQRTHRDPRDDSRWDIYQSHHAPGQSHD